MTLLSLERWRGEEEEAAAAGVRVGCTTALGTLSPTVLAPSSGLAMLVRLTSPRRVAQRTSADVSSLQAATGSKQGRIKRVQEI